MKKKIFDSQLEAIKADLLNNVGQCFRYTLDNSKSASNTETQVTHISLDMTAISRLITGALLSLSQLEQRVNQNVSFEKGGIEHRPVKNIVGYGRPHTPFDVTGRTDGQEWQPDQDAIEYIRSITNSGQPDSVNGLGLNSIANGYKERVKAREIAEKNGPLGTYGGFPVPRTTQDVAFIQNYLDPEAKPLQPLNEDKVLAIIEGMGNTVEDFNNAVADAYQGQYERLKEFGIHTIPGAINTLFLLRNSKIDVPQNLSLENFAYSVQRLIDIAFPDGK